MTCNKSLKYQFELLNSDLQNIINRWDYIEDKVYEISPVTNHKYTKVEINKDIVDSTYVISDILTFLNKSVTNFRKIARVTKIRNKHLVELQNKKVK